MMSVLVLSCICMLPALVVADVYSFGGCDVNFNNDLAQVAMTQEGINTLKTFSSSGPASVYVWNPSSVEKTFKSFSLTLDLDMKTFSLSYTPPSNITVTIYGNASYEQNPKTYLKLDSGFKNQTYQNIFSFNEKGVADLYPLYVSTTDLILRGCNGAPLGKTESLYVFTTNNYTSLDAACAVSSIKTRTGWTVTKA